MAEPHLPEKDVLFQYFKDFLSDDKNNDLMKTLRSVVAEFRKGLGNTVVMFVRLTDANAASFVNFKKATVECEAYKLESDSTLPVVAPFALFFLRGYLTLRDFVDETPKVPRSQIEQQALKDLLEFLTNTRNIKDRCALTEQKKTELEAALAVRVTQNLLVPLAPHKHFVIDCHPDEHGMHGNKGDTSFGCHKGWHGKADILGEDIPVTVVESSEKADDLDKVSVNSDSSVEEEKSEDFDSENISQITAQTIVNSFVQNKRNPNSPNSLVPGVGIGANKLVINLYDCVEDIFVASGPVDVYQMYARNWLNVKAIVMLWLALNHGLFGNKTPEMYQNYTAKFHDVLGAEKLKVYKQESDQPFLAQSEDQYLSRFMQDMYLDKADGLVDVDAYITENTNSSIIVK